MFLEHITKEEAYALRLPKTNLQTILISNKININKAKKWLKHHGYNNEYDEIDTWHYNRFRQNPPIIGARYYSKKINDNLIFIYQTY